MGAMNLLPALAAALTAAASTLGAQSFEAPFRVKAADGFVDTDVGHAAPYLYDIDGDGKRDLLVGQFGGGQLRIYRNIGADTDIRVATHDWLRAAGQVVTTPAG